jgi:hypothetical protein
VIIGFSGNGAAIVDVVVTGYPVVLACLSHKPMGAGLVDTAKLA